MASDKVTLAQAAGQVGVHINTIKTWRRSGYLKSAELIIEHGVEVWHVDLDEAIQVAQSKRKNRVDSSVNTGGYPAGYPETEQESTPAPAAQQAASISVTPGQEQTITFMRESVVRPLVEANQKLVAENGTYREEIGTLKERLRNLEAQLEAAQAARAAQPAPEPAQLVRSEPVAQIALEPPKRGFWARIFNG